MKKETMKTDELLKMLSVIMGSAKPSKKNNMIIEGVKFDSFMFVMKEVIKYILVSEHIKSVLHCTDIDFPNSEKGGKANPDRPDNCPDFSDF